MNEARVSIFLFLLFFLVSCSRDDDKEREEAIDTAKIFLNKRRCDDAIEVLEAVGRNSKHAKYIQTLASAYACKSGYTAPIFYGTNLPKLAGGQNELFGSLVTFTTSNMSDPSDPGYLALQTAIDLLAYAGGVAEPTSVNRAEIFSSEEASDINIQNMYMIITQLGKYLYYYGNADPTTGTKGAGNDNNLTNGCFYDYNPSNAALLAVIDGMRADPTHPLGSCTTNASGHTKLAEITAIGPNTNTVKRMCQGVVLFNLFIDIVTHTTVPLDSGDLGELGDNFASVCADSEYTGDVCNVKNQANCELDYALPPASDKLQAYFFIIFETLLK